MLNSGIETWAAVLLAGLAAGWLAGLVTRGRGFGPLGNTLVALPGALAGLYAGLLIGLISAGDRIGIIAAALTGAFGLLYLTARFRR